MPADNEPAKRSNLETRQRDLETFFRFRAQWHPGDALPENAYEIVRQYIYPYLHNGMYYNALRPPQLRGANWQPNEEDKLRASRARQIFRENLQHFGKDPDRRASIEHIIVDRIFPSGEVAQRWPARAQFTYKDVKGAINLFAQRAAGEVNGQLTKWAEEEQTRVDFHTLEETRGLYTKRHLAEILTMLPDCLESALGTTAAHRLIALALLKETYGLDRVSLLLCDQVARVRFPWVWEHIRATWQSKFRVPTWEDISEDLFRAPSLPGLTRKFNRAKETLLIRLPHTGECNEFVDLRLTS